MSTNVQFKPLESTNGQNQYILMALLIAGAVFGLSEDLVTNLYMAAVPVVMAGVEIWKTVKSTAPRWSWNIISYLGVIAVTAIPGIAGIVGELEVIAEFVKDNGFTTAIFGLLFPLINQILAFVRSQNRDDLN